MADTNKRTIDFEVIHKSLNDSLKTVLMNTITQFDILYELLIQSQVLKQKCASLIKLFHIKKYYI